MNIVLAVPFLAYLLVAFNIMMLVADLPAALNAEVMSAGLISGARWSLDVGELFVMIGVVVLFAELFKATRTGTASVIDHMLSTLVFIVFLVEFITVPGCGNSTFLILALMSLLDVIAGFTITIVAARRDFSLGEPQ